tara:strand:- start:2303 stop:3355 length:1053 start_codon:yes stop_codon:yes gene_type:complete
MQKIFNFFKKFLTIIIITLFFLEITSFFLLKFDNTELFAVRNYTEKTNDKRIFTIKKNFSTSRLNPSTNKKWFIISSNERLRISENDDNISNYLGENNLEEKILFLGDSVPFGFGVNAKNSMPYIFQKNNKNLLALNAAIPSYSLAQTVERYEKEFKNLKNLKYIYIQIYDPVTQYGLLGSDWKIDDNWANFSEQVLRPYNLININLPLYGEPKFYNFFKKKVFRIQRKKIKEKAYNNESDNRYINHINVNLKKINNLIKNKKILLILSSINIPDFSTSYKSNSHLRALKMLNAAFEEFSDKNRNVYYFDASDKLNLQSKKMFIDSCCHLSAEGAELMAKELTKLIKKIE